MARGLPPGGRQHLRHAFAGVGWVRRPDASSFEPIYLTVSNALDDMGEWRDHPADEFSMRVDGWREYGGFRIESAGTRLAPIEKKAIWRHLSRLAKKDAGPSAFLRALVDCALFVASRRSTVSCRLLGLSIPRLAAERCAGGKPYMVLVGMPAPEHATFIYYSETGVGPVHYGPHAAGDGMAVTGFECGNL